MRTAAGTAGPTLATTQARNPAPGGEAMSRITERLIAAAALGAGAFFAARALVRSRRRISFAGKVVFITGGSRGLGLIMARQFAAEGAKVAICARDPEELERARADLEGR